jgi:GT2 family glycosyltransferase
VEGAVAGSGISLITYTFDDHDFVHALIRHVAGFALPFSEIVVVDDASFEPFAPQYPLDSRIKILRMDDNIGPPATKRRGLNAVAGDIVFSVDADVRPHAKWLADSLDLLRDPATGLVGASIVRARTAGYLGAALHRTFPKKRETREVTFLAAGCWLFRREAWERVGGLDDLPADTFEDIFFCRKLRAMGYRLVRNDRLPVYEIRNLHRRAHCKRAVAYYQASISSFLNKFGPQYYVDSVLPELQTALEYFRQYGDPVLGYVFLLKTALLFHVLRKNKNAADAPGSPVPCILEATKALPATTALFSEDMAALGIEGAEMLPALVPFAPLVEKCADTGLFTALEQKWVALYRNEDSSKFFDRHYLDADSVPG